MKTIEHITSGVITWNASRVMPGNGYEDARQTAYTLVAQSAVDRSAFTSGFHVIADHFVTGCSVPHARSLSTVSMQAGVKKFTSSGGFAFLSDPADYEGIHPSTFPTDRFAPEVYPGSAGVNRGYNIPPKILIILNFN